MLRISAATLVGDRFRGIGSLLESLPQLGGSDSTHPNDFISAGLAGDDYEGGAGQVPSLCQELNTGLVCLAVDGRSRQIQFQSVTEFANHRIPPRPGPDTHGKGDACRSFVKSHRLRYDKTR